FGWMVAAPFIGLAFVIALPFAFLAVIGMSALHNIVGAPHRGLFFGWRPMKAYLTGGKKGKGEKKEEGQ
ncbi:MAG TPA: hypothetical protein VEI96_04565, partial [Thermodesulfovibrionales bacterium]|nr:hypothetical protein [Thermodesulfovibrionales bacterium]